MDILSLKRRARGHHCLEETSSGGWSVHSGDTTANNSAATNAAMAASLTAAGYNTNTTGGYSSTPAGGYTYGGDAAQVALHQQAIADQAALAEAAKVEAAKAEAARLASEENHNVVTKLAGGITPTSPTAAAPVAPTAGATPATQDKSGDLAQGLLGASTAKDGKERANELIGFNLASLNVPGAKTADQAKALTDSKSYLSDAVKQSQEQGVSVSSLIGEPSLAQLKQMKDMGYGGLYGVNPNNKGQNVDNMVGAQQLGKGIGRVGSFVTNLAVNAMPGGAFVNAGLKAASAINNGASAGDVAKDAAWGLAGGWASSKINGAVAKAIGPSGAAALSDYGKVASLASLADYKLPSLNAGGYAVGALRKAFGPDPVGPGNTNMTLPDGTPVVDYAGRYGSSGSGSSTPQPAAPQASAPAAAAPASNFDTNMRFNLSGAAAGRAIREGAAARTHKGF
jgi:hypothetical protein